MKTQFRLLKEIDEISVGDEYLHEGKWFPASSFGEHPYGTYRRPIENQWIALSDRKPTKEDGEQVFVRYGFNPATYSVLPQEFVAKFTEATHWCRIPEFHEEDPFEEWFHSKESHGFGDLKQHAQKAFNAGRDYEKGKK